MPQWRRPEPGEHMAINAMDASSEKYRFEYYYFVAIEPSITKIYGIGNIK